MGKGADFERYIAKMLGKWWTGGERDDIFWRTSQSGGRATIRKKSGKSTVNQDGDLCAIDPIGQPLINKTTIELKVGYDGWSIKELIDSKPGRKETTLEAFFKQSSREAEGQGKDCWCLITKQTRREILIFMNHKFWKWLKPRVQFPHGTTFISIIHSKFGPVHVLPLQTFLDNVKPELFNEEP